MTSTWTDYRERRYFPELDGLRALCALAVISFHMRGFEKEWWKWFGGGVGVIVFFVLSGYLITTLGLREEDQHGRVSLPAFYVRRCCRIFPLYYLVLALYVLLIGVCAFRADMHALPQTWDTWPYLVVYLQEVAMMGLTPAGQYMPFAHSWTLGVEEKFYLVWPILAFVLWSSRARPRRLWTVGLVLAWLPLTALLALGNPTARVVGDCLFGHFHILVGCLLALLLHERNWFVRLRFLGTGFWTALAGAVFLTALVGRTAAAGVPHLPRALEVIVALAAATLIGCLLLGDGPLHRLLRSGPLTFVGRLSYGVYLLHMVAMAVVYALLPAAATQRGLNLLAFALTSGVAVGTAWLLAVTVERPLVEVGRRWSKMLQAREERRVASRTVAAAA
jgi:peptidoglycan/LPS O-acetylase OafA/YrhL